MPRDSRSRSPHRHGDHHRHKRTRHDHANDSTNNNNNNNRELPFSASPLSKHDLDKYRPLFALYLDIQKRIDIDELDDREVKGRWKSFVGKWNHGDLAEGWYDPNALERAVTARQEEEEDEREMAASGGTNINPGPESEKDGDGDDDDEFGPVLPTNSTYYSTTDQHSAGAARLLGAAVPSVDELKARSEDAAEAARLAQERQREALHSARRADKKLAKERLEDLAPRAEPGSRERQLEKKREANLSNRAFAQAAHEAGDVDLKDSDVMGDEDSLGELKRLKQQEQRKKNERELRREEILRARREEREQRGRLLREKEDKTIEYLRSLAKERFG